MPSNDVVEKYFREVYSSRRRRDVADGFKRALLIVAFIVATVAVVVLVAVSPLALRHLGSIRGLNWARLSNIGQTYGAASALLTGLALIGVAGSMIFQVRAIEISRAESIRGQHAHLIEMALTDPVYMRAWGHDPNVYGGSDRLRQLMYINLIVSFWEDHYSLGDIHENTMRSDLATLFRGQAGREFWAIGRYARPPKSHTRRRRRFYNIVEEEYQKAVTEGPPTVLTEEFPVVLPAKQRHLPHDSTVKSGVALLIGAIGGIVFETLLRRRK